MAPQRGADVMGIKIKFRPQVLDGPEAAIEGRKWFFTGANRGKLPVALPQPVPHGARLDEGPGHSATPARPGRTPIASASGLGNNRRVSFYWTTHLEAAAAKVLCVDDEPQVLTGLRLHLRRDYEVLLAQSGEQALALLAQHPDVAVILSDMRMPGMDGASFLARARRLAPLATRLLLTGYADTQSAIRAVNQGHLYRYLTKPCPPQELLTVIRAAAAQHHLQLAERELLEQTLSGSVAALSDTLSIAMPEVYGGISPIRQLAEALGVLAGLQPAWPLRIAAMLLYAGYVGLPRDVAARAVAREALSAAESEMLSHAPAMTRRLLQPIPRMEVVCAIIAQAHDEHDTPPELAEYDADFVARAAGILRLAMDYRHLRDQDLTPARALEQLALQVQRHPRETLDLLRTHLKADRQFAVVEHELPQLRVGMVLAEGLRTRKGVLVAARDYVISEGLLERLRNYPKNSLIEPIRVLESPPATDAAP